VIRFIVVTAFPPRSSRTRCGCTFAFRSACAWSRTCWRPAPAGTLDPFDHIEAEIYFADSKGKTGTRWIKVSRQQAIENGTGIVFEDQTIQIDVGALTTKYLTRPPFIALDFKRIRDGVEVYLGVKVRVPVREPLTKGEFG
jgi:hypothetical protein